MTKKPVQLATICYIDNGKEFLLLHRNKKENDVHQGNGLGSVVSWNPVKHRRLVPFEKSLRKLGLL